MKMAGQAMAGLPFSSNSRQIQIPKIASHCYKSNIIDICFDGSLNGINDCFRTVRNQNLS